MEPGCRPLSGSVSMRALALILVLDSVALSSPATGPDGIDDAITALYAKVRSGDDAAAAKAAATLASFGGSAASRLAASAADRTPPEIVWALRCLRAIGSTDGRDLAFGLCSHGNAGVRAEAVWTTSELGQETGVTLLLQAASDADAIVRRRAFDGILAHGIRAAGATEVASKGILDVDFWVVLQAFQILDQQPRVPEGSRDKVVVALGRLVPQLEERNAAAAFDLLVRRAGMACGPMIETGLDVTREAVVMAALHAARQLRLATVVLRVQSLAKGSNPLIAKAAIQTLASINDPNSVAFLVDLLASSREPGRVDAIAVALRTMTGRLYGTDVEKWRKYLADK